MKKLSWPLIIILIVSVLGLYRFISNSSYMDLLVFIVLIAAIILLFKFPPNTWKKKKTSRSSSANEAAKYKEAVRIQKDKIKQKQQNQPSHSKTLPFKVIEGGKDDKDSPRYH